MQKIGNITSTADANGEWTNGNVAAGTAPTILDAAWLNTIQRELIAVISAAGLTLNPSNDAQLLAALKVGIGPGRLLGVKVFTSSGIYTPTPGTASVIVELLGGGGAGGGIPTSPSYGAGAPGGGGGGYGRKRITSGFSGVMVTIGTGGIGLANNTGNNGGSSSFGSLLTCTGGTGGGVGSIAGATNVLTAGVVGIGGTATSADISVAGGNGAVALIGPAFAQAGNGGCTEYAPYTYGPSTVAGTGSVSNGTSGLANRGGGGSGAFGLNNGIVATGGNGGSGLCIVWEYA